MQRARPQHASQRHTCNGHGTEHRTTRGKNSTQADDRKSSEVNGKRPIRRARAAPEKRPEPTAEPLCITQPKPNGANTGLIVPYNSQQGGSPTKLETRRRIREDKGLRRGPASQEIAPDNPTAPVQAQRRVNAKKTRRHQSQGEKASGTHGDTARAGEQAGKTAPSPPPGKTGHARHTAARTETEKEPPPPRATPTAQALRTGDKATLDLMRKKPTPVQTPPTGTSQRHQVAKQRWLVAPNGAIGKTTAPRACDSQASV